ncbi:recombinase family protein [Burkholderia pseudomallei]|uniref:recombinase family protein n=1 Tax=Burkholderia pseudomallei TaxID=28450 RepID=UPI0005314D2A|nr:recombinase family protein [Burkholderia pseudomallei]KGS31085.1 hypothetical protein X941_2789 [Burkholderia pseudomallei MSHR5569]MBM5665802.1 recombinase family protein [Burkholderia pseudomallei]
MKTPTCIATNGLSINLDNPSPKAYSYVRFSTKRQAKGDSLMRQLDKSREYAAEYGLDLQEKSFEDLGVSAFDRSNVTKGALAAFIRAVEAGAIERGSFLLVENLDRLSRADVLDAMNLLSTLVKLGVRVVTLVDRRILDEESVKEPMNLMYAVLVFVRANEESATKADRVKKAHKRKRDNCSTFAFGQGPGWLQPNADRTGWEVIPERAESVRRVFEYTAKGYGATAIAKIANEERWPVPGRAADWHKTLPNKLIHNRRVLGEFEPQIKEGKQRRPTGELWQTYYPAIVSEELFNAANAAVERRRLLPKRRDNGYHNVFQGMLRCGHCGATLARKSKSGTRNSAGYGLYVCADRDRGLTNCPNWNARELEDALIPPLMTFVAADVLEGTVKQQARAALEIERTELAREGKAIKHLVGTIERIGTSDTISARILALEASIEARRRRVTQLAAQANDPVTSVWSEDVEVAIGEALRAVRDVTLEMAEEREALHQSLLRVVKQISVWPKTHAAVELHQGNGQVFLPLSEQAPIQDALKGLIAAPRLNNDTIATA